MRLAGGTSPASAASSSAPSRTGRALPAAINPSVPALPGTASSGRPISMRQPGGHQRARAPLAPRPPAPPPPAPRRSGCATGTASRAAACRAGTPRAGRAGRPAISANRGRVPVRIDDVDAAAEDREGRARPPSSAPRCAAASIPSAPPETIVWPCCEAIAASSCVRRQPARLAARAPTIASSGRVGSGSRPRYQSAATGRAIRAQNIREIGARGGRERDFVGVSGQGQRRLCRLVRPRLCLERPVIGAVADSSARRRGQATRKEAM